MEINPNPTRGDLDTLNEFWWFPGALSKRGKEILEKMAERKNPACYL